MAREQPERGIEGWQHELVALNARSRSKPETKPIARSSEVRAIFATPRQLQLIRELHYAKVLT